MFVLKRGTDLVFSLKVGPASITVKFEGLKWFLDNNSPLWPRLCSSLTVRDKLKIMTNILFLKFLLLPMFQEEDRLQKRKLRFFEFNLQGPLLVIVFVSSRMLHICGIFKNVFIKATRTAWGLESVGPDGPPVGPPDSFCVETPPGCKSTDYTFVFMQVV